MWLSTSDELLLKKSREMMALFAGSSGDAGVNFKVKFEDNVVAHIVLICSNRTVNYGLTCSSHKKEVFSC